MSYQVNAVEHAQAEKAAAAAGSSCWISQTAYGSAVTQVKQSTQSQNNLFWMNFQSSGTVKQITFEITFKQGSPLLGQMQKFEFPGGYSGGTATPFGVPYWGGNPILGPALLMIKTDAGDVCEYKFDVVA